MKKRAALYIRVSTDKQHTANQLPELQALASARGFEIVKVYEETESAKKRRPVFDQLMNDVRGARGFDVLLVWALDRLQRSMVGAMETVLELDRVGVPVVSAKEPWLDTTGPVRQLLIAIFGWVAEQEHARIVERTIIGLEAARRRGSRLGRPRAGSPVLLAASAEAFRNGNLSAVVAARHANVSPATFRRYLASQKGLATTAETPAEKTGG